MRWEEENRKTRAEDRSRRTRSRGQDQEDRKPAAIFFAECKERTLSTYCT